MRQGRRVRSKLRRTGAGLLVSLALAGQGCELGQVGEVLSDLARERLSPSLLVVNLQGLEKNYGGGEAGWQERYSRIATWMAETNKRPDLIALQEVAAQSRDVKAYETLFTLISKIREKTNLTYRIAYLIVRPAGPTFWQGNALLYDPESIGNRTLALEAPKQYDDQSTVGVHPRTSFPCQAPPEEFADLCTLIDADRPAWIASFTRSKDGRWEHGTVFARLELKGFEGRFLHLYNVHHDPEDEKAWTAIKDLIAQMEGRLGGTRIYPPILGGDFNAVRSDTECETTPPGPCTGQFPDFEIAGYAPGVDEMGVLVGESSAFPSERQFRFEYLVVPEEAVDTAKCGRVDILWSDHCGILMQFSPSE